MNWKPGPARTRDDKYVAEILATDMGGALPLLVRWRFRDGSEWRVERLQSNGLHSDSPDTWFGTDLLPPTISLEEAARECEKVRMDCYLSVPGSTHDGNMLAALRHFLSIQESVRDE